MLVIFLFAIDATIVSTSMPTIVARLGGLELYGWVFSIYMLTSALSTPVFGKLADLFSRRRLMLAGIAVFVVGSTLCGMAWSMKALVVFRAIQGLGGGAIYALSFIIAGVLYPPDRRARVQGVISGIWGVSSVLGPLAGGLIVEHASWRWVFFVNLPIAALSVALIATGLREAEAEHRVPKLDLAGTAALLAALMLMFYALSHGAHNRRPLNPEVLSLLGLSAVFLTAFYLIERRAEEPVIPLDLFPIPLYRVSSAVAALAAMGVFGAISYLPLYLQGVTGLAASRAGAVLLVLSLGWTVGSLIADPVIRRGGYRFAAAAGMASMALGYSVFVFAASAGGVPAVVAGGCLIGVGMGMANLTSLVAAQSAVPMRRIGVATSTIMLFRTFGGAFCISLMGTVLLDRMQHGLQMLDGASDLPGSLRGRIADPQYLLEPAARATIPASLLPKLTSLLADALWYAFLVGLLLMIAGLAASLCMQSRAPHGPTGRDSGRAIV